MSGSQAGSTRFALRNNSRVAYDPGSSSPLTSERAVVVLLHDLLNDRNSFTAQRSALSAHARIIAIDARGHGASATLANQWYTMSELAQDVIAVLNIEEIPSAHIVGHGLGGATAFELARRHPERVRTLTMIEPALFSVLDNDASKEAVELRNELRTTDRAAGDAAYKGLTEKALDSYLRPRWGSEWRADATRSRLAAIRRHANALAGLLPAIDSYVVPKNELRNVLVPTSLISGDDAIPVVRLTAERITDQLPVAKQTAVRFGSRINGPFNGSGAEALNSELSDVLDD